MTNQNLVRCYYCEYDGPCPIHEIPASYQINKEPVELALCEQDKIILRPDVLYILRVMEGCEDCETLAKAYENEST